MPNLQGQFAALYESLRETLSPEARDVLDQLMKLSPGTRKTRGFADLGANITAPLEAAARLPEASAIARAVIAGLAVDIDARMADYCLTDFITHANARWKELLYAYLAEEAGDDYAFPSGEFVKDFRFVHGMSVYFGTQVVDLREGIGPKTAVKLAAKAPMLSARTYFGTSLRFHVENRWLENFDEASWEKFYFHVADLLEAHPDNAGMVSTSWFFDPALAKVSPRLAYLIGIPLSGGAQIVRHHTTDFDIASATSKSNTRRKMYEAGEYTPVSYTFVWNREQLIPWARERQRQIELNPATV